MASSDSGHVLAKAASRAASVDAFVRTWTNRRERPTVHGLTSAATPTHTVPFLSLARARRGFTTIELLVSMTVLIFIVIMMTRIFTDSSNIWSVGTRRIHTAAEGRAIMDFIVKEMTQAIADDLVTFKLNSAEDPNHPALYGVKAYGAESDEVCFVGMVRSGDGYYKRTGNQFVYFVAPMRDENNDEMPHRYRLVRTRRTRSMFVTPANRSGSAYQNRDWWRNMPADMDETGGVGLLGLETIAENVAGFEFWAWSEQARDNVFGYDSQTEGDVLPLWLDIYLELLSEDDAQRAALLWGADPQLGAEFVSRNVKRFNARVFFPNRERALAFRP